MTSPPSHSSGKMFHLIARIFVIVVTCMLISCIEGHEEIWIESDGSGRAEVSYSLPAAAAKVRGGEVGIQKMVAEMLGKITALHDTSCQVSTVDDRLNVQVKAAFKSALDLKDLAKGESMKKLPPGKVEAKIDGLSIDFSRTISPGLALPGAIFMPASQFEGKNLTYIIHLPKAATASNATRIENAGRTLIWDFPLSEAIKAPIVTKFNAPIPVPAWAIIAIFGTVLLLVWILIRKIKKTTPISGMTS